MHKATAIIMAGGDSTRMGTDKSHLLIDGRTLIEHVLAQLQGHFDQILVSAKTKDAYRFPGVEVVGDETPNQGPLMGIVSSLKVSRHDLNFVQACDIPHTNMALIGEMLDQMAGYDAATPRNPSGRCEPLYAVYHRRVLATMEAMLARGQKSVHKVFELCNAHYIEIESDNQISNLNTDEDYRRYLKRLDLAAKMRQQSKS